MASPALVWIVAALATFAIGSRLWLNESPPMNLMFAAAISLAIGAAITLVTRRLLVATLLTSGLVTIIYTASALKRRNMEMVAHAYDLVFYLSSGSTISFLWSEFRLYVIVFLGAIASLIVVTALAWRFDGTRIERRTAAAALVVFALLSWAAAALRSERRHLQFHARGLYLSSFYASWSETFEALLRGQLIEAAKSANAPPFAAPGPCRPAQKPPHIILLHMESAVPPALFPSLAYDRRVDAMFLSDDGKRHKLRVETYGGASWLTEFSVLAGISTHAFGGMRQFVQLLMSGKLRDTMPEALARCGYRNVLFYPLLKSFVSSDKFYQSIGFADIFDINDQGAKSGSERDRFYYGNALALAERHIAERREPLLILVLTMFAHLPYTVTLMPEENVSGGDAGADPEMHEYLRRLSMAQIDLAWLEAELARRFPNERFLIVQYGDHQPIVTRSLLGIKAAVGEDKKLQADSLGYITYYAAKGINFRVPKMPDLDVVDVPYLGSIILGLAGLPLSEAHRERMRLMAACGGRYHTCPDRRAIPEFHRRLIDSRLMEAR